jgi:cyclopropane-fatty-acyl-phospholipid synthase
MKTAAHTAIPVSEVRSLSWSQALCRRALHKVLGHLTKGHVRVTDADGNTSEYGNAASDLSAHIQVRDPQFYPAAVLGGGVAVGESFARGDWYCENLPTLIRIFVRNENARAELEGGATAALFSPLRRMAYTLQRNTRKGSRRNIAAHYDLGNDFFGLFLDPTMMYSAALYSDDATTLEEASQAKLRRICETIDLKPEHHLVEIGTGWGGFAEFAAREYGCRVTTTTISKEQYALARKRIAKAGLEDRVTLLLDDYRDLTGKYDRLVSIEMIEAVGAEFYDEYFEVCQRLLKPGGRALIQAITIRDDMFEEARHEVDFIKKYIFPGSCIPSLGALRPAAEKAGFEWQLTTDLTEGYVKTLAAWRDRFLHHASEIRDMGFDDDFIRLWTYYFGYCEGGFAERQIGTYHLHLTKGS